MTANERPEQRKGSAPGQPHDEPAGQSGWLDAETAENVLDAGFDAPYDDPRVSDLARLLATAVQEADSLPGSANAERLVLQAFRDAHDADRAPARSGRRRAARWRRASRPTKVLVGGIAAVSVLGGVALAATTGKLPGPFHIGSGTPGESRSASATPPSPHTSGAPGAGQPTVAPSATTPAHSGQASTHPATPGKSAAAEPSLKGLCASYLRASQHGEHLESAAQRRLDAAAGSPADVASYCARLTTGQTSGHGRAATPTPAPRATTPQTPAPRASRPAAPAVAASPTTGHGRA